MSATELEFSTARSTDAAELAALVNSAYRGESSRSGWTTEEAILGGQRTDAALLEEALAMPGTVVLVARQRKDGELLACCQLERRGEVALLGLLTVKPSAQAGGIGRRLLERAENFAAFEWGCARVQMTVISVRAELLAYYERRGYRQTGEHRAFPMDDPRYGLPKRRDFDLLVLEKPVASPSAEA